MPGHAPATPMSGSGKTKAMDLDPTDAPGPAIILIEPQLGENIGMTARAMLNCGLVDLRLVNPRDGWPSKAAAAASAGAGLVLDGARLFPSAEAAIADLVCVFAATARPRDMTKDVLTPRAAAAAMTAVSGHGGQAGVMFGKEAMGLTNDHVALADGIMAVPLNPGFSSLNLAQAVLLVGYEWYLARRQPAGNELAIPKTTRLASKAEMLGLFEHLEAALLDSGFLRPRGTRPQMTRNLRNLLGRARPTEQEVRTLRGVIASLTRSGKNPE